MPHLVKGYMPWFMRHSNVIMSFSKLSRKSDINPGCEWFEKDVQEALNRIQFHEIKINEASRMCKNPSCTIQKLNCI